MTAIAIVHPMTLVGKELRERLESHPSLTSEVRLYSTDEEEIGTVTDAGGAAGFVNRLDEEALLGVRLAFFCGDIEREREALRGLPDGAHAVILSNGAGIEDGRPAAPGFHERLWAGERRLLSPAPAALLLARLLATLTPAGARSATATVVHPVSGLGQRGLDALFEETRALLTFSKSAKSELFGGQVAFNLLPGRPDGEEIERQVAALTGEAGPRATVQSAQAGIFHGVTASVLVEGDAAFDAAAARKRLAADDAFALSKEPAKAGPIEAAGEERVVVGELRDAGPGRVWVWAAIDNLITGGALNALAVAEIALGAGTVH